MFSSVLNVGANLAAMVLMWGYKLILVFSEKESPVANLVTKGSKVEPTLLVQHDSSDANQAAAVQTTLASITSQVRLVLAQYSLILHPIWHAYTYIANI